MDLRVKRTTKNIKDAFFELRKKKSIEKISVKELSELAMINKATFYLHYRDIYELSDKLEIELVERIISEVKPINFLLSRENFKLFSRTLSLAIIRNDDEIRTLFSGYENNHFINHLERTLKNFIFSTYPSIRNNNENNIFLTFIIQGSFHTYIRNSKIDKTVLIENTTNMTSNLAEEYNFFNF